MEANKMKRKKQLVDIDGIDEEKKLLEKHFEKRFLNFAEQKAVMLWYLEDLELSMFLDILEENKSEQKSESK